MDVLETIRSRRSVRRYNSRPIPEKTMEHMKAALRLAPSACNLQPWKFVFVTEKARKKALADAARNQAFIAEAPVIVVGVGFPEKAYKHMGGSGNSVEVDVAIALDHLTLAAAAEGLGTCWIGAFDEHRVRMLIAAPPNARVVAMTTLGYPAESGLIHPVDETRRHPADQIFVCETF